MRKTNTNSVVAIFIYDQGEWVNDIGEANVALTLTDQMIHNLFSMTGHAS